MTARPSRLEPLDLPPLRAWRCDWCGGETPKGRKYCNADCGAKYNNLLARQGKAIIQLAKQWRIHRGKKGTPGAGATNILSRRVDEILDGDRTRWAAMAKAREAQE